MPQILSMEGKEGGKVEKTSRQSIFSSFGDWFSSLHKFDRLFLLVVLLVIVSTPFIVSNYQNFNPEAAKPGGGCAPTCVLTVTPNQVPKGSPSITISGSGFAAGQSLTINTGMFPEPGVTTDGNGAFSILYSPAGNGGFYISGPSFVQALDPRTLAVLATGYYTVCSTNPCEGGVTPTPTPIVSTPKPTPSIDTDGDGFSDTVENYIGTDPNTKCSTTTVTNPGIPNPAWPPDFNNDNIVNTSDTLHFSPHFNTNVGDTNYDKRYDLNGDRKINTSDVLTMSPVFNKSCTSVTPTP